MKKKGALIGGVSKNSIAEDLSIEKGDILLGVNGEEIGDIFDYNYLINDEMVELDLLKAHGERYIMEITKDPDEDIGIIFEDPLIDGEKRCENNCIFCFIDQLPEKMRETLYFKDDDFRLSFLTGNYVTLTNTKRKDLERIVKYHMSPINVSVHTTNPQLRSYMLGRKRTPDVLEQIGYLTDNNISVNAQIVLCRGINDGEELDRTLADLSKLYPGLKSISIVPVGLTRFRQKAKYLVPFGKNSSLKIIERVSKYQGDFLNKLKSRIVFLADEFYLTAGVGLPSPGEYEDFSQLENGVGLMSLFIKEFKDALEEGTIKKNNISNQRLGVVTGMLSHKSMAKLCCLAGEKTGMDIRVFPIKNEFFGESVTVTGLLTGGDIIQQLRGQELPPTLLMCGTMLRAGEEVYLDDTTVGDVGAAIKRKIIIIPNDGGVFARTIMDFSQYC